MESTGNRDGGEIMDTLAQRLAIFEQQERELQFDAFTNEDALQLGLLIVKLADEGGQSITVDITRKGQRLFVHAMKGRSVGNEDWIRRKNNTAGYFGKSCWRVALELRDAGRSIEEEHGLDTADYAAAGGAFPLVVKGEGMIGTVTVSG